MNENRKEIAIIVDEDGKMMNFIWYFGYETTGSNYIRPYAYYCFHCQNTRAFPAREHVDCMTCGEPRFIRAVVKNGDVMWIK